MLAVNTSFYKFNNSKYNFGDFTYTFTATSCTEVDKLSVGKSIKS